MQASHKNNNSEPERADLDRRYGKIGIPAVAAALRYCSNAKNPAHAAAAQAMDEREDVAA